MEVGLGLVLNDKGLVLKEAAAAQYKFSASEANGLEKLTTAGLSLRWDGRGLDLCEVRHGLRGVRLAGHLIGFKIISTKMTMLTFTVV